MKRISLTLSCLAFGSGLAWPQTPASSTAPTPSAIHDKPLRWETYTNPQYGFSIQYPLVDIPEPHPQDRQNIWDEGEIDVPTADTENTGIIIRCLTEASVAKWNKYMEKNGYEDMEPFPYSMKDLY